MKSFKSFLKAVCIFMIFEYIARLIALPIYIYKYKKKK